MGFRMCVHAHLLSHVRLFATPLSVACQTPPFMGFPRQEHWSGLLFPFPGDLPNPGIEPKSPALQVDSLPLSYLWSPGFRTYYPKILHFDMLNTLKWVWENGRNRQVLLITAHFLPETSHETPMWKVPRKKEYILITRDRESGPRNLYKHC